MSSRAQIALTVVLTRNLSPAIGAQLLRGSGAVLRELVGNSARLWPKLRAGYLLDALDGLDGPSTPFTAIPMYLRWVDEAEAARQPSAGLGEDVRLRGEHVIGPWGGVLSVRGIVGPVNLPATRR